MNTDQEKTTDMNTNTAPDFSIRFTEVNHARDHWPKAPVTMDWSALVDAFHRFARPDRTALVKDGPATIGATFREGGRIEKASVETCTMLGLDIDGDPAKGQVYMTPEDVHAVLPFRAVGYSTFSSTLARRKYRLLFPLETEVSPADHARLWAYVNELTGGKLLDQSTKNPDRMFFDPPISGGL